MIRLRCGRSHTWACRPDSITGGHGCPQCAGNAKLDQKEVEAKLRPRQIKLIRVIDRDFTVRSKAKFECRICSTEWTTTIDAITHTRGKGTGCPQCAKSKYAWHRVTKEGIEDRIKELRKKGLELLDEYTRSDQWYRFKCLECGKVQKLSFNNEYYKEKGEIGCKECRKKHRPIGGGIKEQSVRDTLQKLTGRKFEKATRKILPWLRGLHLDGFCSSLVTDNFPNGTAFEFQGEHHYRLVNYGGHIDSEEKLENRKKRDRRKRIQCWRHGVKLITIPYWIKDLDKYLRRRLQD